MKQKIVNLTNWKLANRLEHVAHLIDERFAMLEPFEQEHIEQFVKKLEVWVREAKWKEMLESLPDHPCPEELT